MATPEEELQKFRSLIGGQPAATNQSVVNAPPPMEASAPTDPNAALIKFRELTALPVTQNTVNQVRGVEAVPALTATQREGRRDPATGELVPISNEGLGSRYWRIALQRGPEAQMALISKLYPDSQPRTLENGAVAMTITDSATGKPKEVVVNPVGIEAHDLIDLATQAPEIAAGTAAAIMTQGRGFMKTAAQMVLSSLAGAGVGAVRDVASRTAEGIDPRLSEIAASRTGEAALDLFLQTSMLGGAKAFRALSPFSREIRPETLEFDAAAAQRFFKDKFGEDFPMTPAEITGSPALQAIEAAETPQPGARTVMQKLRERRSEIIRRIQDRSLGRVTGDESIGERSIETLRQNVVLPIENALETAKDAATAKGNKRLSDALDAITMPSSGQVSPTMAGVKTTEEFEAKLAQAKSKVDAAYAQVNAIPGGSGDVLDGTFAADMAQSIRDELPKATAGGTTEVLTSGVDDAVLRSLEDLESLRGKNVSLQTLTNMRRAAFDEIAKTEAVPGVQDRWFKKIAAAYDRGMQQAIDATGNPQLKTALTNAKETYKKELLPFDRPGLKELARGEFDTGRLSPEQVAARFFEGPKAIENYRMLKETLGADNPALRVLKRSWVDSQIADVTDPISGSINAQALGERFRKLNADKPELARELFGSEFPSIMGEIRYLSAYKNLDSLDDTEVRTLMSLPNPSKADFQAVLRMQQNRDEAYANSIIADIGDGEIKADKIKPTEFVKRIMNAKETPTPDVERVLATLESQAPEVREAIATATFYKILNEASVMDASEGARTLTDKSLNISAQKLKDALGRANDPKRQRLEMLLGNSPLTVVPGESGPTRMEVLENLAKLLGPQDARSAAFGTAGGLAAGMNVLNLMRHPFQYATSYAKKLAAATVWTDKAFTKIISNRVFGPEETAAAANALIASEPFLSRLYTTVGDETKVGTIVNELKDSIDRFVAERIESPQGRERAELGRLTRGEPANVRIQPTK